MYCNKMYISLFSSTLSILYSLLLIKTHVHEPGFILLQAYKKLSLFMTILAKKIMTFFMTSAIFLCHGLMFSTGVTH